MENKNKSEVDGENPEPIYSLRSVEHGEEALALAKSMTSLSDMSETDVAIMSRMTSEDHDLITPEKPSKNWFMFAINWWLSWAIPGMGMFSEAYILFAIGNIKPLLRIMYPNCWGKATPTDCDTSVVGDIETIEICGIIGGMLILGFSADWIGRKWGSRLCTSIMIFGSILLTAASGSATAFLVVFATGLCSFGFGVGGEYPLASSSAAERAEGNPAMRKRRGETVVLTFTQQGWGNWSNTLVILILLAMVGATGNDPTSNDASIVIHVQFAVALAILLGLAVYRFTKLKESAVWEAERKGVDKEMEIEGEKDNTRKLYWLIFKRNWSRLLVTSGAWVVNDLAFYGNKLFQSKFIAVISGGDATIYKNMQWTLLNSTVALAGYFCAAFLVDKPWYGRVRMQAIGFSMMFILFLMCGIFYNQLVEDHIHVFQFLYFFSSFWNQFGPNATTWLVAGEVFPTDVRAFYHGTSAAFGKAGAIAASQIFNRISERATFYVSAGAGAFGAIITILLLPDTTGLDLAEIDRLNRYLLAGKEKEYHGEAVNPKHMSLFEKMLGWHKAYDPVIDEEQRTLQNFMSTKSQPLDTIAEDKGIPGVNN
ncbi:Putative inorganic phosphate transporter 1-12 [Picochlorum sp. SENEW3]|nr:Putative inorganic phosphate transporter 1-12 [Picochlorum sp. SENEW3]